MKLLKALLAILILTGAMLVVGGLLLPASTRVERSTTIDRPPPAVFATLDTFADFNAWSPWAELDPQARYLYSGPAVGVGAKMSWAGSPVMGSGSQEILESVRSSRIVNAVDFGNSQATATYTLMPRGAGTELTWALDTAHGYNLVSRWLGALALDHMIGRDLEKGLAKLKAMLESGPVGAGE